jgi:hypothetical protein
VLVWNTTSNLKEQRNGFYRLNSKYEYSSNAPPAWERILGQTPSLEKEFSISSILVGRSHGRTPYFFSHGKHQAYPLQASSFFPRQFHSNSCNGTNYPCERHRRAGVLEHAFCNRNCRGGLACICLRVKKGWDGIIPNVRDEFIPPDVWLDK